MYVMFTYSINSLLNCAQLPLDLNPLVENKKAKKSFQLLYYSPPLDLDQT